MLPLKDRVDEERTMRTLNINRVAFKGYSRGILYHLEIPIQINQFEKSIKPKTKPIEAIINHRAQIVSRGTPSMT